MLSATIAFTILVAMFYIAKNWLGVGLCAANLGLRLIESTRAVHLSARFRAQDASERLVN